jgi:hypothetical protein
MSRKNSPASKVRQAYSQAGLTRICTLREDRFGRAFGMTTTPVENPYRSWQPKGEPPEALYYHFKDNGSRVLAVAHLDTVMPGNRRTPRFTATANGPLITSGALDDRLGAYVILDLLPKLGVTCDWLLTVGEETGQSTAEHFKPAKNYDHVIEFDRGGTDVVMYQYEDRASRQLVEACGATMGQGSFSDIASLGQLGVKAFNWGVGYRGNYHSESGYAYLDDTFGMVAKYLRFHEQNAGVTMPHDLDYQDAGSTRHWWEDDDTDYYGDCSWCGERCTVDSVNWYCKACGMCDDCGGTNPEVAAEWVSAGQDLDDMDVCQCFTPSRQRASLKSAMDDADRFLRENRKNWTEITLPDDKANGAGKQNAVGTFDRTRKNWTGMSWEEYLAQRPIGQLLTPGETARQKLLDAAADADAEELDAALAAAIERDGDPVSAQERGELTMWQQGIEDAVRQAQINCGRWTIRARSPRSAITELTVDATAVKEQVQRLQFTEGYQILAITQAAATNAAARKDDLASASTD